MNNEMSKTELKEWIEQEQFYDGDGFNIATELLQELFTGKKLVPEDAMVIFANGCIETGGDYAPTKVVPADAVVLSLDDAKAIRLLASCSMANEQIGARAMPNLEQAIALSTPKPLPKGEA